MLKCAVKFTLSRKPANYIKNKGKKEKKTPPTTATTAITTATLITKA